MNFELGTAIAAGLIGTLAMTAIMYMGYFMGMKMDMPMMLGTMLLPKGNLAWAVGLMLHFMMGAIFFIVYAALFDVIGLEDGIIGWAALFGLAHGLLAGIMMAPMGIMHPRVARAGAGTRSDTIP